MFHIRNELPFPRTAVCVRMLGRDILSALEVMVGGFPRPQGCFPQLSGNARLVYDDEKVGSRAALRKPARSRIHFRWPENNKQGLPAVNLTYLLLLCSRLDIVLSALPSRGRLWIRPRSTAW